MPKRDDESATARVCDGCGMQMATDDSLTEVDDLVYCHSCTRRLVDDPVIAIQGRTLHLSELERQAAEGDENLAAALEGDTVQEQIKAAKAKR